MTEAAHARFLRVVQRGLERADREQGAELARLRPERRQTPAERRRLHGVLVDPRPPRRRIHRARSGATAASRSE